MNLDSRLSGVLHLLLHLMEAQEPVPSERLATALNGNPVVVRRTLAGLRDGGLVSSEKGHGGGWKIACDPAQTSVLDVYRALGSPTLFAMGHRSENPSCLIEQAVNVALGDAFQDAEMRITATMGTLTLAALATDFKHRLRPFQDRPLENPHVL
jgi:DNA-binding IscR family transcriptional regulator